MRELKTELRVTLKQTLTPQLYQLLKLLQMPYLELEQTVRNELEKNPLLDEAQEVEDEQETTPQREEQEMNRLREIDWAAYFQSEREYYYRPQQYMSEDIPERVPVAQPSIRDHLIEQLHLNTSDSQVRIIGEYIIDSLDDDGFLDTPVEEIAEVLNVSCTSVLETLKLIQTFDPPGVASRSVEECLTIQLYQHGYGEDSVEVHIVNKYLKEIGAKQFSKIKRGLGISEIRAKEAIDIVSGLNPKPFRGLGTSNVRYIVPDLILKEVDDGYKVIINETTLPSLRINSYYREILNAKESLLKEEKEFIKQKLDSALNLMKGLEERRRSILKVAQFIVETQKGFFDDGIRHLVPLTMQKVAETVGLHESTVSRIVQGKYIDTPRGLLELKFFFSGGIAKDDEEDVSSRSVKDMIRSLVEKENKQSPLQDKEIVDILSKEGIRIARRTVAKYRNQLKILPARLRKET
jgi:RNA polymerase sigma-54 factor